MRGLALLAAVLLMAGCLAQRDDDASGEAECEALLTPDDVPASAGLEGGRGPRLVRVEALVGAGEPVLAYWPGDNGTVEFVALRTGDGAQALTVHARAGVPIGLLAGREGAGWRHALAIPAGDGEAAVQVSDTLTGEVNGVWDAALATGVPDAVWQPQPLPDLQANLGRVTAVQFTLAWTNGAGGGADFGIALASGADGSFQYTNRAYQAQAGDQSESRDVPVEELLGHGWGNGTPAQAGPSVSTGAFATTGIPYTLSWVADLRPADGSAGHVCDALGPVREADVTSR